MPAPEPLSDGSPSLLLHNARILTMDRSRPSAEAVAVTGERILAVGRNVQVLPLATRQTQSVDCLGRLLVPGFIDAHLHLLGTAARMRSADCSTARSIEEILQALRLHAAAVAPAGWLRGFGYHELTLREGRHPLRWDLDAVDPRRPIRLTHLSGHASVLNSAGLSRLGIDAATEEPPGGTIDRDVHTGEPSGLLLEMEDRLDQAMPPSSPAEIERMLHILSERLLAAGVTSVQDLGHRNDRRRAAFLAELVAAGHFRPRITLASGYAAFEAVEEARAEGIGRGPVKIVLNETGESLRPGGPELARQVRCVDRAGAQVAIHAIGPAAISAAIDAIEQATLAGPARNRQARRHRIEHASITPPALAARMAALGIAAVSNPGFLWQNGDRYLSSIPPAQLGHLYDVAGLDRAGVVVAAGSDSPIGPLEPLVGIRACCDRRTAAGRTLPGEPIDLPTALARYTSAAAKVGFEEDQKGCLAPGLLADLALLEESPDGLRVCMTVLGGQIVWANHAC